MNDDTAMDDVEQRLSQLTPRGARPELRGQVLEKLASELENFATAPKEFGSPRLRRSAWAVAASLLLGIGLNVWADKASERHLARLFGPPPISKQAMEIANAVEKITDAETGRWVYQRLATPRRSGDASAAYAKHYAAMEQLIRELNLVSKDSYHETLQKDSEVDRDRTRRIDGDRSDCQRLVRLDYRCTA